MHWQWVVGPREGGGGLRNALFSSCWHSFCELGRRGLGGRRGHSARAAAARLGSLGATFRGCRSSAAALGVPIRERPHCGWPEGTLCACRGGTLGFPRRDVQRLSIKRRGPRCPRPGAASLRVAGGDTLRVPRRHAGVPSARRSEAVDQAPRPSVSPSGSGLIAAGRDGLHLFRNRSKVEAARRGGRRCRRG